MLGVVPHCRDGISIVIAHHQSGPVAVIRATGPANTNRLRKLVHQPVVVSFLFVGVVVVLIAGYRLGQIEAERLGGVRILVEQATGKQVVDAGVSRRAWNAGEPLGLVACG